MPVRLDLEAINLFTIHSTPFLQSTSTGKEEQIQGIFSKTSLNSLNEKIPKKSINPSDVDLELLSQEFILETKQIQIANHPYAFNPSIIRYNGAPIQV